MDCRIFFYNIENQISKECAPKLELGCERYKFLSDATEDGD